MEAKAERAALERLLLLVGSVPREECRENEGSTTVRSRRKFVESIPSRGDRNKV